MAALTIFMMLMAVLAGIIGMGSIMHLMRDHRSPEAIWTYRCLLISNLLLVVGLGFRYLEYHLAERFSVLLLSLIPLVMLDLLIPLKLAFLHSLGRMGVCLTYDSRESFMRMIELLVFPAVGLAVILFSAVAFIFGLSGVAYGIHNVFEFLLITAMLGLACYYGLLRTHRLADALRRRAAHRFFLLQAVTFGCAIVGLALHGTIPQPGGALLGAATMFFYNAVLVLWAHRYLPPLESALETADGSGTVHLLKQFGITKREGEVIRLICEGKSNKEIADRLFISMDTVKDHNHNIFRKTGVTNRVQLVNLFRRVRRIEL